MPTHGAADQVFQVFEIRDNIAKPQIAKPQITEPNQILIANERTTFNPADCKQRSGNLQMVVKHEFPLILGQDFAGTVVEIGSAVTKFQVGDQVLGSTAPRNSCATEYVCAYEHEVSKKPSNVSWEEAAAIPTGYCTACKGFFDPDYGNLHIHPNDDDGGEDDDDKKKESSRPKSH